MKAREELLESISQYDDEFMEMYLEDRFNKQNIIESIRRIIQKYPLKVAVILLGSGLKNKGIQPLMDSLIHYLPTPNEKNIVIDRNGIIRKRNNKEQLTLYCYKNIIHPQKGNLMYVRIYSGVLKAR